MYSFFSTPLTILIESGRLSWETNRRAEGRHLHSVLIEMWQTLNGTSWYFFSVHNPINVNMAGSASYRSSDPSIPNILCLVPHILKGNDIQRQEAGIFHPPISAINSSISQNCYKYAPRSINFYWQKNIFIIWYVKSIKRFDFLQIIYQEISGSFCQNITQYGRDCRIEIILFDNC